MQEGGLLRDRGATNVFDVAERVVHGDNLRTVLHHGSAAHKAADAPETRDTHFDHSCESLFCLRGGRSDSVKSASERALGRVAGLGT